MMQENGLKTKLRLISKFLTTQTGQHIIAIEMFSITSRSKGNQAMKFGQLIKDKVRNIFL